MALSELSLLQAEPSMPLLLALSTDEGITAYNALPEEVSPDEAAEALEDVEPLILGHEPLERGAIWERMALAVDWRGEPQPAAAAVLSALDLALWQLAAEQASLPLYALFGGRFFPHCDTYELLRPDHLQLSSAPPGGVLIAGGENPSQAVSQAEDLRRRWGDQGRLFTTFSGTSKPTPALELAMRLQAIEVFYCLDLLPMTAVQEYGDLGRQVELPLGAGAQATGLQAYRQLLQQKALDLVAVDLRRCGGITGARHLACFAAAEQLPVAVLAGSWPLNQLLALHLASTSGLFLPVAVPELRAFTGTPFVGEEGFVTLSEAPGLGGFLAPDELRGYKPL